MLTAAKFEEHCARLVDPAITNEQRRSLATEVRDSIELVHSGDYAAFLSHFLPAFRVVLTELTTPQVEDNVVHKTRAVILEVLNRLPHNEVLRAKFTELLPLAMNVLQNDSEDNAVTAIHIIFDLHKSFRPHLESQVQPFLDFVRTLYSNFGDSIEATILSTPSSSAVATAGAGAGNSQQQRPRMAKASQSFKVINQCPLLVMFVFQLYPKFLNSNIKHLLPLMVKAIEFEIPPARVALVPKATFQEFIAAQVKTVSFFAYLLKQFPDLMKPNEMSIPRSVVQLLQACPGDAVSIRKELLVATRHILSSPFRDGFFGQIDILLDESVLVGSGRSATDTLRPLAYSFLAEFVHGVRLNLTLQQLSKIIHLFSTNLHDPRFTFALHTNSVRLLLNLIEGILKIDKDGDGSSGAVRGLLVRIMSIMVAKYATIGNQVPRLLSLVEDMRKRARCDEGSAGRPLSEEALGDPMKEINDCKQLIKTLTLGLKTVICCAINVRVAPPALPPGPPAPGAAITGSGVATAVPPISPATPRMGLLEQECEIMTGLLETSQNCFRLYSQLESANGGPGAGDLETPSLRSRASPQLTSATNAVKIATPNGSVFPANGRIEQGGQQVCAATVKEEKEILDLFAQIFTVLDVRSFQDVFGLRMPDLYEHIVANPAALAIPQHFLANNNISKYFADILLNFLVARMPELGVSPPTLGAVPSSAQARAQSLLRLFKILFASVTLFAMNEPVLRMHLGTVVRGCLHHASRCEDPFIYLQLLRSLFKSLTNGKHEMQFELLYRDFMPLVEPLFTGLLSLYKGPHRLAHKELIVELCLMVPARPSTIFPYLGMQMKTMVWALEGGRDNVHYGLRTLEFWVEMLQPVYLETLLADVEPQLTAALQRHLRPQPSNVFSSTALRILGKLGSRSRGQATSAAPIDVKPNPDPAQRLRLHWKDGSSLTMETDEMVRMACAALMDERSPGLRRADALHKRHAWGFLRSCLIPFLGLDSGLEDQIKTHGAFLRSEWFALSDVSPVVTGQTATGGLDQRERNEVEKRSDGPPRRTRAMHRAEVKLVRSLLSSLVAAAGISELNETANKETPRTECGAVPNEDCPQVFAHGLCQYFALLFSRGLGGCSQQRKVVTLDALPATNEVVPPSALDPDLLLDAIVDVMSRERREHAHAGLDCLKVLLDAMISYGVATKTGSGLGSSDEIVNKSQPAEDKVMLPEGDVTGRIVNDADDAEMVEPKESGGIDSKGDAQNGDDVHGGKVQAQETAAGKQVVKADEEMHNDDGTADCMVTGDAQVKRQGAGSESRLPDAGPVLRADSEVPPTFLSTIERLCHCCYQRSWHAKWAGAAGLGAVIERVPASVFLVRSSGSYQAHVVRALMFVVRDLSESTPFGTSSVARKSLQQLLRLCYKPSGISLEGGPEQALDISNRALRDVTVCIMVELTSDSTSARDAAKHALQTLSEALKCDVADIMSPTKDQILRPLQQRSIRQLSFPVQIGYIDAVTFCLQLEKPMLATELFSAPLRALFLSDVVGISEESTYEKLTEAEDGIRQKLVENKLVHSHIVQHLTQLRRKAIEFLRCVALKCPEELQKPANDDLFRRMISSFFKSLQSRDAELVQTAKKGLKQAISQHQKPKELLQQNLRPILGNLSDYKKLTISYLQGLSRVLELLSHWFNVNLGEKLLEHLQRWTEPEKLVPLKRWTPGTESRVGAAILDLFHLLPPAASKFLVQIVHMVLRLESVLTVAGPGVSHLGLRGRSAASTSPYREPLLKYCNQHATVSIKYFLSQLDQPQIRHLFFVLLRAEKAGPLRDELMGKPERLIAATFFALDTTGTEAGAYAYYGVVIVDLLSQRAPEWLSKNRDVVNRLLEHWKAPSRIERLSREEKVPLERVQESQIMSEIFIRYSRQSPEETEVLFALLLVFSVRTLCDFTFVKDFFLNIVAKSYSASTRRAIMSHFLTFFADQGVPQERKVHALQLIVIPMLSTHLESRQAEARSLAAQHATAVDQAEPESTAQAVSTKPTTQPASSGTHAGSGSEEVAASGNGSGSANEPVFSGANVGSGSEPTGKSKAGASTKAQSVSGVAVNGVSAVESGVPTAPSNANMPQDEVLDSGIVQRIMRDLLDQPDEVLRKYDELLSAELLQLATLLIQYMPVELGRYRKELIKFGWNHLKREDSIAKQWAFVNVSRFFEAYQAPEKIILQVYVALLRACQGEGRHLVRQALDVLTPALPLRLAQTVDHKYPIWIRYTKKILLEEGHSIPHLVHIWQLIVRHPSLFYLARAQFVPIMVNSMSRIGLNASAAAGPENRRLSLDLADLIISWDMERASRVAATSADGGEAASTADSARQVSGLKRARDDGTADRNLAASGESAHPHDADRDVGTEPPTKTLRAESGTAVTTAKVESNVADTAGATTNNQRLIPASPTMGPSGSTALRDRDEFRPTSAMVEMIVNFLAQVAFRQMDRRERQLITRRCVSLIDKALLIWPDCIVRLHFVQRVLDATVSSDRGPVSSSANSASTKSKSGQMSATHAGVGAGASGDARAPSSSSKAEALKTEKTEVLRLEHAAMRVAALHTALELSLVMIERQGAAFATLNAGPIRSMVLPAMTDRNLGAAAKLAKLITILLRHIPTSGDDGTAVGGGATTNGSSQPIPTPVVSTSLASGVVGAGSGTPVPSPGGMLHSSTSPARSSSFEGILGTVDQALERCLKSTDTVSMHCGLIVLEAVVAQRPTEFSKYQELLVKAFLRMAKENSHFPATAPSAAQMGGATTNQLAGAGNGAPSAQRPSGASAPAGSAGAGPQDKATASSTGAAASRGGGAAGPARGGSGTGDGSGPSPVPGRGASATSDGQTLILCLSLLGKHISSLEAAQRKSFFHAIYFLIDRCLQVQVLLEIVRVIGDWVKWKAPAQRLPIEPSSLKPAGALSTREPLSVKEKVNFLLKMIVFERISGQGSRQLMSSYLNIVLSVFGGENEGDRRPELLPKLERAFMIGLKAADPVVRGKFFAIYDNAMGASPVARLHYTIAKQDWEPLRDSFWIRQAVELLIVIIEPNERLVSDPSTARFPQVPSGRITASKDDRMQIEDEKTEPPQSETSADQIAAEAPLIGFISTVESIRCQSFTASLRELLHADSELAHATWISVFPRTWALLGSLERASIEKAFASLLSKEYHLAQMSWPRNVVQALLDGASRCSSLPPIRPEVLYHLGSRWNAWHIALPYLERSADLLRKAINESVLAADGRPPARVEAELESVLDASAELYRLLNEQDYFAGVWKSRARSISTVAAITLEQRGCLAEAQDRYADAMGRNLADISAGSFARSSVGTGAYGVTPGMFTHGPVGKAEICLWEERWILCAQKLCQWEVLTEFSRSVVHSELLHESLWRLPDWSALKELLIKNPVEDGPKLKLYQAYVQLQENKLDVAETFIMQGYQRALERYCSLPLGAGPDSTSPILVQFQQLVELQESGKILGELNALSRHGSGSIDVEQKIESVRLILNTWRERLPAQHESLSVWNDILTWRNHVHAVVVNVLEALKEAASAKVAAAQSGGSGGGSNRGQAGGASAQAAQVQAAAAIAQALPQQVLVMGVNETAWNVHRFARACRKQGLPDVAIHALHKLYPFGTMELTEYFVKTKETAKSFIAGPAGLDNNLEFGLGELNRCNMDHFNPRQKAQLFTIKGKFYQAMGRDDDVAEAFSTALSTSSDVGSAWLAWARHCDAMQEKAAVDPSSFAIPGRPAAVVEGNVVGAGEAQSDSVAERAWREAAANCYLQAVRFGSRKTRLFLPRALRLLTVDVNLRQRQSAAKAGGDEKHAVSPSESGVDSNPATASTSVPQSRTQTDGSRAPNPPVVTKLEGVMGVYGHLIEVLPAWIWLPWLSQLVPMLGRAEAVAARSLLARVAQQYPQALFFPLRAYMEERKAIDRPVRHLASEALKLSRPNTPALLPAASSAQLSNATRQTQQAKENVQKANQRFAAAQENFKKSETTLAVAAAGTPEHAESAAKTAKLKEELGNAQRVLERSVQAFQLAQQKQVQVTQTAGSSGTTPNPATAGGVDLLGVAGSSANGVKGSGTKALPKSTGAPTASAGTLPAATSDANTGPTATATSAASKPVAKAGDMQARQQALAQNHAMLQATAQARVAEVGKANAAQAQARLMMMPRMPYEHADVVMARLVKSHQGLYVEIERIAQDLSVRLKPQQEEQLLGLMNALLHRCYQFSAKTGKEVAPSLRSALEEVSRMCFGTAPKDKASSSSSQQKIQASIADLKPAFEAELAPQTAKDFPTRIEPFIARLRRWKNVFQRRVDAMPETQKLEMLSRHLIEVHNSDVEVFGQYLVAEAAEPSPDMHVKIERFGADTRVIRRHAGPSRGISILGSNGKQYNFLLETSINGTVQPTEDRAAQLFRLFNSSMFARDAEACRRRIRLEVPTFVSTGPHTRLVSDDLSFSSLAEGLERHMESIGGNLDDPLMAFRGLASEAYTRRRASAGEQGGREESIAARVEAYHEVCASHAPDTCLSDWVAATISSPNMHFTFRKRFAETLGTASLVSYALAIGARRPQNVMFSWTTGAVCNMHSRALVSARGVLECDEAVPFRLTRNIRRLLGAMGVEGPLFGSMAVTMSALRNNEELLRVYLDAIMRDELTAWVAVRSEPSSSGYKSSRSGAVSSGASGGKAGNSKATGSGTASVSTAAANVNAIIPTGLPRTEFELLENRLAKSVEAVVQRLDPEHIIGGDADEPMEITTQDSPEAEQLDMVSRGVHTLIDRSGRPENLAQMESSWQAWF